MEAVHSRSLPPPLISAKVFEGLELSEGPSRFEDVLDIVNRLSNTFAAVAALITIP